MFAVHPPDTPAMNMPMVIGQELMQLLCQSSPPGPLAAAIVARLGMGLRAKFCLLVHQAPTSPPPVHLWLWSVKQGEQCHPCDLFWQHPWIHSLIDSHRPLTFQAYRQTTNFPSEAHLDPAIAWDLSSDWQFQHSVGLRTIFQGQVNGLVIIGLPAPSNPPSPQEQWLMELQPQLSIVNQLLPREQSSRHSKGKVSQRRPTTSVLAGKNTIDDSPIMRLWYDATRQQLEQQRQWNEQLIHNIVTIMSDQTRNPLATIRMGIEMLRKAPPSPEKLEQRLAILEQEWHKLNSINEKILQFRSLKYEQSTVPLQQLELRPILQALIQADSSELPPSSSTVSIHLTVDDPSSPYTVEANPNHLQRILQELLTNACKFSSTGGQIHIALTHRVHLGKKIAVMTITNPCPSLIPAKHLKSLFEPFYREQKVIDTAIPGIGLGLTIVQALVNQINGQIEIDCQPAVALNETPFATFEVTLSFLGRIVA